MQDSKNNVEHKYLFLRILQSSIGKTEHTMVHDQDMRKQCM